MNYTLITLVTAILPAALLGTLLLAACSLGDILAAAVTAVQVVGAVGRELWRRAGL